MEILFCCVYIYTWPCFTYYWCKVTLKGLVCLISGDYPLMHGFANTKTSVHSGHKCSSVSTLVTNIALTSLGTKSNMYHANVLCVSNISWQEMLCQRGLAVKLSLFANQKWPEWSGQGSCNSSNSKMQDAYLPFSISLWPSKEKNPTTLLKCMAKTALFI